MTNRGEVVGPARITPQTCEQMVTAVSPPSDGLRATAPPAGADHASNATATSATNAATSTTTPTMRNCSALVMGLRLSLADDITTPPIGARPCASARGALHPGAVTIGKRADEIRLARL
jgi:hypothetical protein